MPSPALGIDLGTTFSVVAVLDEHGQPRTLANAEGELTTPSVVLLSDLELIVGKEAAKAAVEEAEHVADCAKRALGKRYYPRLLGQRRVPPQVLQACVLRKLIKDAEATLGPCRQAVITVPAYFDDARRQASLDAAAMAGIEVLDILNEPTAAAIAFGRQQQLSAASTPCNLLVYDLGGGTFDVTVMEILNDRFTALATDGDARLGGRDWDERLMRLVREKIVAQGGVAPEDSLAAEHKLWRLCEELKRTLTARSQGTLLWEHGGASARIEITRAEFEHVSRDLLERTAFTTRQTLQAAGLEWSDVDYVLLVGGASRMPAVEARLRHLSGKPPQRAVSPDEAVAHGAALHAGALLAGLAGRQPAFEVRNVNAHSLGVAAAEASTRRARTAVVIPRNTPLPASGKRTFRTQKRGQKSILVRIVEGESPDPSECAAIGRCVVQPLPEGLPAGAPIEVLFRYGGDGRLSVAVRVADAAVQHELHRENTLGEAELDSWREFLKQW